MVELGQVGPEGGAELGRLGAVGRVVEEVRGVLLVGAERVRVRRVDGVVEDVGAEAEVLARGREVGDGVVDEGRGRRRVDELGDDAVPAEVRGVEVLGELLAGADGEDGVDVDASISLERSRSASEPRARVLECVSTRDRTLQ